MEEFDRERPPDPAETRVRSLRDALVRVAARLETLEEVRLREDVYDPLWHACGALVDGDLGRDAATVGTQFEAFFERIRGLLDEHADPVPAGALGLANDARFLNDMAAYLTRRYGLTAPASSPRT